MKLTDRQNTILRFFNKFFVCCFLFCLPILNVLADDWQKKYTEAIASGDFEKAAYFAYQSALELKNQHKTTEAVSFFQKALEHAKQINNHKVIADTYYSLAIISAGSKDHAKAIAFFESALKAYHNFNDRQSYAIAALEMANSYIAVKDFKQANVRAKKALNIGESLSDDNILFNAYSLMAQSLEKLGKKDEALAFHKKSLEKQKEIQEKKSQQLTGQFEEKQRQSDIELSKQASIIKNKDKALVALASEKALIEEINARKAKEFEDLKKAKELEDQMLEAQEKTIKQAKQITNLFIAAVVIGVFFIIFLIWAYLNIRKSNGALKIKTDEIIKQKHEIDLQKSILEERNQQVTDSIRYAEKIQYGILADPSIITALVSSYFIIYRPKDIVSGDFYWFAHHEDYAFAAVVDCTGHGVPGAFMSMIGNTLLNEIVYQKHILDPSEILGQLHLGIRRALRQENKGNDDGMDLCLCRIEHDAGFDKKVIFAGAKRPIYIFRQGEIIEIKGDKKSVGGRQKEEKRIFTNHELLLNNGDMIYLCSDGLADQPNEKNDKLGTPFLINFLKKIGYYRTTARRHHDYWHENLKRTFATRLKCCECRTKFVSMKKILVGMGFLF